MHEVFITMAGFTREKNAILWSLRCYWKSIKLEPMLSIKCNVVGFNITELQPLNNTSLNNLQMIELSW